MIKNSLLQLAIVIFVMACITVFTLTVTRSVQAAVTLVYFRTVGAPTQITVEWQTASEVDMVGFYVLKADALDSTFVDISGLIYSQGDAFGGATYQHLDDAVVAGQTVYYKLQVLDRNQNSTFYGPIMGYAGMDTPTPTVTLTPTLTATNNPGQASPTVTQTAGTSTPTRTGTVLSPTRTRTQVPFPTITPEKLSSTRTPTPAVTSTSVVNSTLIETTTADLPTAIATLPMMIPVRTATQRLTDRVNNDHSQDALGWALVGTGFAGLLVAAGWLIWTLIKRTGHQK